MVCAPHDVAAPAASTYPAALDASDPRPVTRAALGRRGPGDSDTGATLSVDFVPGQCGQDEGTALTFIADRTRDGVASAFTAEERVASMRQ
jgi:hypothetical protein